jgi:hypothetical protein
VSLKWQDGDRKESGSGRKKVIGMNGFYSLLHSIYHLTRHNRKRGILSIELPLCMVAWGISKPKRPAPFVCLYSNTGWALILNALRCPTPALCRE